MSPDLHLKKTLEVPSDFVPPAESPLPPHGLELTAVQRQKIIRGFAEVESVQRDIVEAGGILPEHQMYLLNTAVGLLQLLILKNRNAGNGDQI